MIGAIADRLGMRPSQGHHPGFVGDQQRQHEQQARPRMPGRRCVTGWQSHEKRPSI